VADIKTFASSTDVAAFVAKARAERRPDQSNFRQPIVGAGPYTVNLEYRAAVGNPGAHDTDAEFFYIIEGSGIVVIGGQLVMEARQNAENRSGTGIEGGTAQRVSKGDLLVVPVGASHWFRQIDSLITDISLHLPMGAPE